MTCADRGWPSWDAGANVPRDSAPLATKGSAMPGLRHDIDPDGLQEFSVVFTDRSLNHMS